MTVTKQSDGSWLIRGRTQRSPRTGRFIQYKRVFRGTKTAAKALDAELAESSPDSEPTETFKEVAAAWMKRHEEWASATRTYYRYGVDSLSRLHKIKLSRLTPYDCERALLNIPPGSTRLRARKTLTAVLNHAIKLGVIDVSPMIRVDVPDGCPPPRRDRYTPEECAVLLKAVRGDRIEPAVILSMMCGLRKEECLGLAWDDVDLENGLVSIRRACTEVDGRVEVKPTKTAGSVRTVPLAGYALERMRELGEGATGCVLPSLDPPLTDGHGNRIALTVMDPRAHMRPSKLYHRFGKLTDRAGLRRIPFENLRHTFATAAVESGVPLTALQSLLGHSRFATTAGYVASLHTENRTAVEKVAETLSKAMVI